MIKHVFRLVFLVVALSGCLTSSRTDRPFSKDWTHQIQKEKDFEARKQRLEQSKKKKTGLRTNREGKPALGIGGDSGISADVGSGGGTLKYGVSW